MTLMVTALYQGDVDAAVRWGHEVVRLSDEGGVVWLRSMARSVGAVIEYFHDLSYAEQLARAGLALAESIGNPTARALALFAIGVATESEDPEGAVGALSESIRLSDDVGNQWAAGMSRIALLRAQSGLSDRAQVLRNASELLRHWLEVGDWAQVWTTLQLVAALLGERGRDADAVTVEAALVRAGAGAGFYRDPLSQQHAAAVAEARARLSVQAAQAAYDLGERLTEREVVERVLTIIEDELLTTVTGGSG